MSRYRLFKLIGFLSLLFLIAFAFGNVGYLQILLPMVHESKSEDLCNSAVNGIKLCTPFRKVVVTSGEAVVLSFSLLNTSERELQMNKNDGTNYSFRVAGESGRVLPIKREQDLKKNSGRSGDELKKRISSSFVSRRAESLASNQTLKENIVLSDIYDLTAPGKYHVELKRKTIDPNGGAFIEISLETITIEVVAST